MAERRLAQRQVTDVTIPQDNTAQGLNSLADTAMGFVDLQKKKDLANMNDFMADAQLQMLDVTNKWRVENESDPTNQEATAKLHANYDKILGQYNDKVGLLSRGDWIQSTNKIKNQYQIDNLQWGQKQTVVNMESRVNGAMQKNFTMFASLGKTDDINKFKQTYQNSKSAIEAFSQGVIGEEKKDKLMQDYASDAMSSYLLGLSEINPKRAKEYLDRDDVRSDLGSEQKVLSIERMIDGMDKAQDRQLEENKVTDRFNILGDIYEGKMDWKNSFETINKIGAKDPELAEAMTKNLEKEYKPEEDLNGEVKNKAFLDLAQNIFKSKDSKTISDFLVNTLSDNKNISRDRLGILVYAAKQRAEEVKQGNGKGFWDSAFNFIMQTNPITAPFVLFNTIKRAKDEGAQGKQILSIARDETDKEFKKVNPKYTIEDIEYTAAQTGMTVSQVLEALRSKGGGK
jgi:hypothetical protein